jgi:hypothetical protein
MASRIQDNGSFDPRITKLPGLQSLVGGGKKLSRGFIIQEKPVDGVRYRCNFLYNPSVLNVSHSVNSAVQADDNALNPNDVTAKDFLMPLQQTVQFSLLFDRTYEMWDSSRVTGAENVFVPALGVGWDISMLYKITGISASVAVTGEGTDAKGDSTKSFRKGQFSFDAAGPMLYVPVYLVVGDTLNYYGVIQDLEIQYTHWTQQMIPSRCQVSISMQLLPKPKGGGEFVSFGRLPAGLTPDEFAKGANGKAGR